MTKGRQPIVMISPVRVCVSSGRGVWGGKPAEGDLQKQRFVCCFPEFPAQKNEKTCYSFLQCRK